ncbi:MAG: DUF1611 domain-containing protein, partial [Gammaproteobacteria bacterium]|nr:DUF1611 domain-containing protein [Gammaproteobacteria bacterium]
MHQIQEPYLLMLGDVHDVTYAKTAYGLLQWAPERCKGQWRFPESEVDLGLPEMTPETAAESGIKTVVIGVATPGGGLSEEWQKQLIVAANHGLDIASGMHMKLIDVPDLVAAAAEHDTQLHDVRVPPADLPVGSGRKRTGKRLLTVGTDCAVGKKYAALAIAQGLQERNVPADFRATGQTGILITGSGVPIDAVVSDFLSGAAEILSPDAAEDHWDIVEGQGSLYNPSFAGVTVGLLHGTQPDAIVMCHEIGRKEIIGVEAYPTPGLGEAIEYYVQVGHLTSPDIRCVGVSVNSSALSGKARQAAIEE